MVEGMFYILRTGVPWRDLPASFGPWSSVYTRFRRWCRLGLWEKLHCALTSAAMSEISSIDCTHVKVHQDGSNGSGSADSRAIGKTKGGTNCKIGALVDFFGRAIAICLAAGNRHDLPATEPLRDQVPGPWLIGDRGFDSPPLRQLLAEKGIHACIPPKANSSVQYFYSKSLYRSRHVVENFFQRIKRFRRIGTRYEKLAETFLGFVTFAATIDWIQFEV